MTREELTVPKLPFDFKNQRSWGILFGGLSLILLLPWIAFSTGQGLVTAIDPNERVQSITAPVTGFIRLWHAKEGQRLKRGDLIAELSDNDPNLLNRLMQERDAAKAAHTSATLMRDTAMLNLERQKKLFEQGLSARKDYEKSKIEYSKHEMDVAKALVTLTKAETQLSRQSSQEVRAPLDGVIVRVLPGERGQLIKGGSPIAVFAPDVTKPAVELWIDGNDSALVQPGQRAQIQFEGWPSLQIAGWPSVAINTFPGKVHLVDRASSSKGRFRVLIVPDGNWPSQNVLRLGVHAKGYIQLSNSFILRELWRQLNDFPAFDEPITDELAHLLKEKDSKEERSEDKPEESP